MRTHNRYARMEPVATSERRRTRTQCPSAPARGTGVVSAVHAPVLIVNILALVAVMALLSYYVIQANTIAALQYGASEAEDAIVRLREKNHAIGARLADREHPDQIASYALENGMVPASDASYVAVPDAPVAGR